MEFPQAIYEVVQASAHAGAVALGAYGHVRMQASALTPMLIQMARGYLAGLKNNASKRKGIRIFCYHGITERKQDSLLERNLITVSEFRAHLEFLRRFRILSLDELFDELKTPAQTKTGGALITFDDGYANNSLAAEILGSRSLPWSLFVSTGAVGRSASIWTVELSLLLLHGQASHVELFDKTWPLNNRQLRETAFRAIRYPLKSMPANLKEEAMFTLRQQFPAGETARLLEKFPSLQMLTWSELSELASASVRIGSHGVNHEIHHAGQLIRTRNSELADSKRELESRLRQACDYFAFPNGDFMRESTADARAAGYKLALTMRPGTIKFAVNPFTLPRISAAGSLRSFANSFFWEPVRAQLPSDNIPALS